MDFLELAFNSLDDAVEDEAGSNTVGDAVAKAHENAGAECRDCIFEVRPVDFLEGAHHHNADDDQCRCRSSGRNAAGDRGKERAKEEHDGGCEAGQTGTSACTDACSTFNIRCGVGGTEDSTDGSCDGVCKQCTVHF